MQIGHWKNGSWQCLQSQGCPSDFEVTVWLPLSKCGIVVHHLLYQAQLLITCGIRSNPILVILGSGGVWHMFIFRRINEKSWVHIWKSVYLLVIQMGYKGWKFYNSKTKKVIISERADFDERYTYGTISESGDIRESTYIEKYTPGPAIEYDGNEQEPVTPAAPPVVKKQPAPVEEEPAPVQASEQPIRPRTRQRARIEPAQDDEDEPDNRPIAIRKSI